MTDWTGGYVSDIEYLPGFYAGQAPGMMDLACIMAGVEPARRPGTSAPFTYCDLGCGQASTVAALAAANAEGRFWGIDFLPAHIARAEAFRSAAGLDNLTLIDGDVAALAADPSTDLPRFDYIALHGLYSWVSEEVRAGIVAFLDRFLRPGGLVYLGYNTLPGWTDTLPLQKLLIEYAAIRQGPSSARVAEAGAFAQRMQAAGASILETRLGERLFPGVAIPEFLERHHRYMAHEFLNQHWQPRFHMDVARELAAAKLDFAGSANPLENFAGIGLSPEAQAILEEVPAGPLRETFEDYFTMRRFRSDVFVRGRREITRAMRESMLSGVVLARIAERPAPDRSEWPQIRDRFTLDPASYGPVFDHLDSGPASVAELRQAVTEAGGQVSGNELVGILSGLDLVVPVLHDVPAAAVEACWRHNRVVTHEAFRSNRHNSYALAMPVGHTGVTHSAFQTLILDGLFTDVPIEVEPLSAHVLSRLDVSPDTIYQPPQPEASIGATDPATAPPDGDDPGEPKPAPPEPRPVGEAVRESVAQVIEGLLPLWRATGVLPQRREE